MRNQSESSSLAAIKTPISQEALGRLFREARKIQPLSCFLTSCRHCTK
jgi:hypothetical protein